MRVVFVVVFIAVTPISVFAQTEPATGFDELIAGSQPAGKELLQPPGQPDAVPAEPEADHASILGSSTQATWPGSAAPAAVVAGPTSTNQTWWLAAPYVWLPGIHGQVTSFGQTRSVDIDISNV